MLSKGFPYGPDESFVNRQLTAIIRDLPRRDFILRYGELEKAFLT